MKIKYIYKRHKHFTITGFGRHIFSQIFLWLYIREYSATRQKRMFSSLVVDNIEI